MSACRQVVCLQSSGAETENALDPWVLRLKPANITGFRLSVEDDRSDLEGK